jgi:GAF domain-containing protein
LVSTDVWHLVAPERCRPFQLATAALPLTELVELPNLVYETGRPVWIRDIPREQTFVRAMAAADAGLQAALAVPVIARDEVVAVLEFLGHEPSEPSASLLQILAGVGEQIGRVVARERDAAELRRYREAEAMSRSSD